MPMLDTIHIISSGGNIRVFIILLVYFQILYTYLTWWHDVHHCRDSKHKSIEIGILLILLFYFCVALFSFLLLCTIIIFSFPIIKLNRQDIWRAFYVSARTIITIIERHWKFRAEHSRAMFRVDFYMWRWTCNKNIIKWIHSMLYVYVLLHKISRLIPLS